MSHDDLRCVLNSHDFKKCPSKKKICWKKNKKYFLCAPYIYNPANKKKRHLLNKKKKRIKTRYFDEKTSL